MREKQETRPIPMVILTSSREKRDMVDSYRIGINGYVQKPVDFDKFRQTIRTLGLYWLEVNQPPPKAVFSTEKI